MLVTLWPFKGYFVDKAWLSSERAAPSSSAALTASCRHFFPSKSWVQLLRHTCEKPIGLLPVSWDSYLSWSFFKLSLFVLPSIGLTPCQARQQLSKGLLGEFVPKCKADGSYEPLQSHDGYSWCVDEDGKEINGTRMRFKQPICGPQALKSGKLVLMTFRILWIYSWRLWAKSIQPKFLVWGQKFYFFM